LKELTRSGWLFIPTRFGAMICRPALRLLRELIRFCARDLLVDGLFTDFPGAVSELLRRIF
jgi:hypothetical protein